MAKLNKPTQTVSIRRGKQYVIMQVIVKGNPDGSFCDLDQIMERLPYETTKPSFAFSIRCLANKGLVTKVEKLRQRDHASRRVIKPTLLGYQLTTAYAPPAP
jgi:hypothetical protein